MASKRKVTGTAASMPAGLAIGLGGSLAVTVLGSAALAWLIGSGRVGEDGIGYGALVILLAASVLGAGAAVWRIRHQRMVVCMLSGLLYYAALLCVTALLFGGQYDGMGVTALVVLAGCLTVGLLGLRGEHRRSRGVRKHGLG